MSEPYNTLAAGDAILLSSTGSDEKRSFWATVTEIDERNMGEIVVGSSASEAETMRVRFLTFSQLQVLSDNRLFDFVDEPTDRYMRAKVDLDQVRKVASEQGVSWEWALSEWAVAASVWGKVQQALRDMAVRWLRYKAHTIPPHLYDSVVELQVQWLTENLRV